jgi:hypothetical protein
MTFVYLGGKLPAEVLMSFLFIYAMLNFTVRIACYMAWNATVIVE